MSLKEFRCNIYFQFSFLKWIRSSDYWGGNQWKWKLFGCVVSRAVPLGLVSNNANLTRLCLDTRHSFLPWPFLKGISIFFFWMELFYVDTIIFQHYFITLGTYPWPGKSFFFFNITMKGFRNCCWLLRNILILFCSILSPKHLRRPTVSLFNIAQSLKPTELPTVKQGTRNNFAWRIHGD